MGYTGSDEHLALQITQCHSDNMCRQCHTWLQVKEFLESFGQLLACKLLPRGPGNAAELSVYCAYSAITAASLDNLSLAKVSTAHSRSIGSGQIAWAL